eukprot:1158871-Pelagomonas_calceolata.AAC.9
MPMSLLALLNVDRTRNVEAAMMKESAGEAGSVAAFEHQCTTDLMKVGRQAVLLMPTHCRSSQYLDPITLNICNSVKDGGQDVLLTCCWCGKSQKMLAWYDLGPGSLHF